MTPLSEEMVRLGSTRSVIRELFEFGARRSAEIGAENVFDFSLGNPSAPPPRIVTETAAELLSTCDPAALHSYTSAQGDASVRAAIARDLTARFSLPYSPDDLYLTMGAAAALCCAFKALTCPGDSFVVLAPYFPEYQVFLQAAGAKMTVVPPRTRDFQIDLDALDRAIDAHTKGVVVNSPNNPSGAVYSPETCKQLADLLTAKSEAYGHPIWLLSDEPYREIVYPGAEVPWLPALYRDTLVCYSYSKSLSIPGDRFGYLLIPPASPDAKRLSFAVAGAARSLGYVCAPTFFQRIMERCTGYTADLSVYAKNRDLLLEAFRSYGYSCVPPQGAFYLFPRTLEEDDGAFCERARKFDLLLVPGSSFGCPGHMRISYCVPTERILRSLPAFQALAQTYL